MSKAICESCGRDFQKGNPALLPTGCCQKCYEGFAADPRQCFGKQYKDGSPLAEKDDKTCQVCPDFTVCVKWPKNSVTYIGLQNPSERQAPVKTQETETMTDAKAAKTPKTKTPKASKPEKAAKTAKAASNGTAGAETVEFGSIKLRKGSSAEIISTYLTTHKKSTVADVAEALKKAGIKSDNPEGRIKMFARGLKDAGLITYEKADDGSTFYASK